MEELTQTIYQCLQDLDAAIMCLQNLINIGDSHRAGDNIISQLSRLRNSILDQVDYSDSRGLFSDRRNILCSEWSAHKFIDTVKQGQVANAFDLTDAKIQEIKILGLSSTPALSELSNSFRNDPEPARRSGSSKN